MKLEGFNPMVYRAKEGKKEITVGDMEEYLQNFNKEDIVIVPNIDGGNPTYVHLYEISEALYYPEKGFVFGSDQFTIDPNTSEVKMNEKIILDKDNFKRCIVLEPGMK